MPLSGQHKHPRDKLATHRPGQGVGIIVTSTTATGNDMSAILNLTQHPATPDQLTAGVIDITGEARARLVELLTFGEPESQEDVWARAHEITHIATSASSPEDRANDEGFLPENDRGGVALSAMIGGAGWLMGPLEIWLRHAGITPLYAFSRRESVEKVQADGTVTKINVFRHTGFQPGVVAGQPWIAESATHAN